MSLAQNAPPQEEKLQQLIEEAKAMTEGELETEVNSRIYGELGELAKYLNTMLKRIQSVELEKASSQIPYVTNQLSDVTRYTEEETHRILEYTEKTMGNHDSMTTALESARQTLATDAPDTATIKACVEDVYAMAEENKKILMDLLMALSFQDLAGQRMRKIEVIMQEVQSRILKLIIALGLKVRSNTSEKEKKDVVITETNEPAKPESLKQGVVDDILKEFGF